MPMRVTLRALLTVLLVTSTIAPGMASPSQPEEFLSRLEGRWDGAGTVLGRPAEVSIEWRWVLDGRFMRLTFVNQGLPFEGHAYYRADGDGYRATWFDSSGMVRPIRARQSGDTLIALWGTPETEEGETSYRLRADGTLEVSDRVRQADGTWRPFGLVTLARVSRD